MKLIINVDVKNSGDLVTFVEDYLLPLVKTHGTTDMREGQSTVSATGADGDISEIVSEDEITIRMAK